MDAGDERIGSRASRWISWSSLSLLLLATFSIRALQTGQPIVENYVGRQIPSAMVARNLERGSGFLRPILDTAPFPNYFVVEPPLYQLGVVVLKRASGLGLEASGRIFSALATALAAWGLFMLARRREGAVVAFVAVATFAALPLTIRYGRAFQPDALMLGAVVAGLASWDEYRSVGGWYWLVAAWSLLAVGFAIKITAGFLLIPLLLLVARARSPRQILIVGTTILPAVLWYAWASHLLALGEGSRASADNRSIWLGLSGPAALLEPETLRFVSWCLLVRAFTPLGAGLAVVGMFCRDTTLRRRDGLWPVWGISAMLAMAFLAQKLHHEYYWLLIAPVVAVGIARAVVVVAENRRAGAALLSAALVLLSWAQVRSTWRTPAEWSGLEPAAGAVRATVPSNAWVVAPEALLFQADRRGCRLEYTLAAAARAAGEWGKESPVEDPVELIEVYRHQGARYFADLRSCTDDPRRKGLHDFVRQRYKVIVDRPEVIIADLADSEMHWNAN
jgi:hypothetical protein